ncbi:MAG: dTDP-4-dehydrorhamnose reductase [Gammaproteobacteria bacterium]|nr:dTDP-4-dehydrorhamnose reductase [Gammaproteobacteria bacterium]
MKIVLLGAAGQLGNDINRYYATHAAGYDLIALSRQDIDATKLEALTTLLLQQTFDILINCIGYTQVDKAESEQEAAFLINAYAVEKMAIACQEKQARFIHISTDYIYGEASPHLPLNEQNPPSPLNIYGASKLLGEQLALEACSNTVIFRSASLFGIAQSKVKANFIETIIKYAKEKGQLRVIENQIMSPTGSADLAKMIFQSIETEIPAGIYHAVNSGQASWYEFACAIIEQAQINCQITPIPANEYPLPAKRPAYSALDNTKLAKLIGPIPDWQEALAQYFKLKNL